MHIYSKYTSNDPQENLRNEKAEASWKDNLPIDITDLKRNSLTVLNDNSRPPVPFLKDIFDYACERCSDDTMLIFSNTDIFCASDFPEITDTFYSVRKNVSTFPDKQLSIEDITKIPFIASVNTDTIGISKKNYLQIRDKIPDFLIGVPYWDLCMLFLLKDFFDVKRIDHITYHVHHDSVWKKDRYCSMNMYNKKLFMRYMVPKNLEFIQNNNIIHRPFVDYMAAHFNYQYK